MREEADQGPSGRGDTSWRFSFPEPTREWLLLSWAPGGGGRIPSPGLSLEQLEGPRDDYCPQYLLVTLSSVHVLSVKGAKRSKGLVRGRAT